MGIANVSGVGFPSRHGKSLIALSMYDKGVAFVAAAALLGERGHGYVVRHLLCQGFELLGKAFLLFRDYGKYRPLLQKPIGHDLERLSDALAKEFDLPVSPRAFVDELKQINGLYKNHLLRYGSAFDVLIDPSSIPCRRVFRRLRAAIRVAGPRLPPDVVKSATEFGMRPLEVARTKVDCGQDE